MQKRASMLLCACAVAFSTFLVSCESSHSHDRFREGEPLRPPVPMRGEALFFDATVKAEITLTRGRPPLTIAGVEGDSERRSSGGPGRRRHGQALDRDTDANDGGSRGPVIRPIGMPALTLRLKLENTSDQPVEVTIADFVSDLGNFAVRPEKVVLAPKSATEVDPMVSQLGATSDELPVKVVLRVKGHAETRVIVVKGGLPPTPQG